MNDLKEHLTSEVSSYILWLYLNDLINSIPYQRNADGSILVKIPADNLQEMRKYVKKTTP